MRVHILRSYKSSVSIFRCCSFFSFSFSCRYLLPFQSALTVLRLLSTMTNTGISTSHQCFSSLGCCCPIQCSVGVIFTLILSLASLAAVVPRPLLPLSRPPGVTRNQHCRLGAPLQTSGMNRSLFSYGFYFWQAEMQSYELTKVTM